MSIRNERQEADMRGFNFDNQRKSRVLALEAFIRATFGEMDGMSYRIFKRSWNSHVAVMKIRGYDLYIIVYNFGNRMEFRPAEADGWSMKTTNRRGQGAARNWLQFRFGLR